jgi:hypothetical protein
MDAICCAAAWSTRIRETTTLRKFELFWNSALRGTQNDGTTAFRRGIRKPLQHKALRRRSAFFDRPRRIHARTKAVAATPHGTTT